MKGQYLDPKQTPLYLWTAEQCKVWLIEVLGSLTEVKPNFFEEYNDCIGLTMMRFYRERNCQCELLILHNGSSCNQSSWLKVREALYVECIRHDVQL